MTQISPSFFDNLARTCSGDSLIRSDGKKLSIFNRIIDFFLGKSRGDHLLAVCTKLSQSMKEFSNLDIDKQLDILGRIHQILDKIHNKELLKKCAPLIHEVEEAVIKNRSLASLSDEVFNKIKEASISKDSRLQKREMRNMEMLLDTSSPQAAATLVQDWSKFFHKEDKGMSKSSLDSLNGANRSINPLFLKYSEKLKAADPQAFVTLLTTELETQFLKENKPEIRRIVSELVELMEQNEDNRELKQHCLKSINQFLSQTLFNPEYKIVENRKNRSFIQQLFALDKIHSGIGFGEKKKEKLLIFRDLFTLVDKNIDQVDQKLKLELKVRFANLPSPQERTAFPNLFLSEKEQLDILISELQKKEDTKTSQLINHLKKNKVSPDDTRKLASILISKSELSDNNLSSLRKALEKELAAHNHPEKKSFGDWSNDQNVSECLIWLCCDPKVQTTSLIDELKRTGKARSFFQEQLVLDESMILIPRWYHTTGEKGIQGISKSGQIEVRHQQRFKGSWVSDKLEGEFGPYTISLSNRISQLDPQPFIGFEWADHRWRGLQKAVPLTQKNLIGVKTNQNKAAQKIDKLKIVKTLKEQGFPHTKVVSSTQLDFIQKEVGSILGNPNLSDGWFSKEKAISQHQNRLLEKIQGLSFSNDLLKPKSDPQNQLTIASLIQQVVVPIYKEPMPKDPSYISEVSELRVKSGATNESQYNKHLHEVEEGKEPARDFHDTMHAVRTTLWTQVLKRLYEKLGQKLPENSMLLALSAGMHDSGREAEGIDHWDGESSLLLKAVLQSTDLDTKTIEKHVQTVAEKDPKGDKFSTVDQMLVHDADCLEITRVISRYTFNTKHLCFFKFDPKQKELCNKAMNEIFDFIELTDNQKVRTHLEHKSQDYYGDLVRLMFAVHKENPSKFPLITQLIGDDMKDLLEKESTISSQELKALVS